MTWGESLQCRMVRVGVSQCPTGGWRKRQGTVEGRCRAGALLNLNWTGVRTAVTSKREREREKYTRRCYGEPKLGGGGGRGEGPEF